MSAVDLVLEVSTWIALVLLAGAFLLTVWRVVQGPTLPDRVVALDMLVGIVIGFIALIAVRTGFTLYIDIAIALGLVGFLATVAFARFILVSAAAKGKAAKGKAADDAPDVSASTAAPRLTGQVPATVSDVSTGKSASKSASKTAEPLVGAKPARTKSKAKPQTEKPPRKAQPKSAAKAEGKVLSAKSSARETPPKAASAPKSRAKKKEQP